MLSPLPPALITSGDMNTPNVMTAAWTGIICSDPVITYVSIRPSRYTHELISKTKEFVINVPTWKIASAVDTVGVKTGRNFNKFTSTGLTVEPSSKISTPQIKECPISMECKVLEIRNFGTHDMFLAEVISVNVDEEFIDANGALDLEKAGLLAYAHGFYYTLGRKIGKFGFSVEKKNKILEISSQKFSKENSIKKFQKNNKEETFVENGVEVIVKKNKFTQKKSSEKPTFFPKKEHKKFASKENKKTSYSETSYKKKSDGSFKKKPYLKKEK
ncbi:MAG: flavin reductase family protein [Alphaproteobacteria bacterium]|nr:flavin reductase family protein [Alphaproteobacteria bacterium]